MVEKQIRNIIVQKENKVILPEEIFPVEVLVGIPEFQHYRAGPPPYYAGPPPYQAGPPPYDAGPPTYQDGIFC